MSGGSISFMPVPLLEPVFIQFCLTQEIFPEAHFGPRFNLEASDAWPEAAMGGLKLQVPKGNQELTTYTGKDMGWGGALHSLMAVPFMFLGELPLAP